MGRRETSTLRDDAPRSHGHLQEVLDGPTSRGDLGNHELVVEHGMQDAFGPHVSRGYSPSAFWPWPRCP